MEIFAYCIDIIFTKSILRILLAFFSNLKERKSFWSDKKDVLYRINNVILIGIPCCNRGYLKDTFYEDSFPHIADCVLSLFSYERLLTLLSFYISVTENPNPHGHDFLVQTFCMIFPIVQLITNSYNYKLW